MRLVLLTGVALLCACSDAGKDAEKRYRMVEKTGSRGEICDAGKAVAAAYLQAGDEEQYKFWHLIADGNCLTAKLEGRDGRPDEYVADALP